MTMAEGHQFGCPYCGSALTDRNVCPNCGIICERCGTPYKGRICPECGSSALSSSSQSSPEAPENTAFGEVAPELYETRGIFGPRRGMGRKEWSMIKGTFAVSEGKHVHDRALEAVCQLDLKGQAQSLLLDRVEQLAKSLLKKFRSVEKAVMFAVSVEAQNTGIPVVNVQNALARAGFTIKFGSILVKVWTAKEGENAAGAIAVRVNGEARVVKARESDDEEDERLRLTFEKGTLCKVRVPLLLTDSLSSAKGDVVLDFGEGSEVISFEQRFGAEQAGRSNLRLQLRPEKAFGLFKVKKQVIAWVPEQRAAPPVAPASAGTTAALDLYMRRFLPSKRLPASSGLMQRAGCLGAVEARFTELFRERLKSANGKMPGRMARRALFDADGEAFRLLSPTRRRAARLLVAGMNLPPEDRRYTGVSGLLVPSEVGGRPA